MAAPLDVAMPPSMDINGAFTVRVTALDATTGNVVSGVNIGTVTITADATGEGTLESGPFMLVPGPGS